jgi:hypothetical protein
LTVDELLQASSKREDADEEEDEGDDSVSLLQSQTRPQSGKDGKDIVVILSSSGESVGASVQSPWQIKDKARHVPAVFEDTVSTWGPAPACNIKAGSDLAQGQLPASARKHEVPLRAKAKDGKSQQDSRARRECEGANYDYAGCYALQEHDKADS